MTIRAIFLLSSSFFSQALLAFPGSTTSPIQFLAYCIFLAFLGIVIQYLSLLSIMHVVLDAVDLELELEEFSRGAQSGLQLDPAPKSLFALKASRKRQPDRYTILKMYPWVYVFVPAPKRVAGLQRRKQIQFLHQFFYKRVSSENCDP